MAQNLVKPDILTPTLRQIQNADVQDNLTRIDTFLQQIVTQFNDLNQQVLTGMPSQNTPPNQGTPGTPGAGFNPDAFVGVVYNAGTGILRFERQNNNILDISLSAQPLTALLTELNIDTFPPVIDQDFSIRGTHTISYHVAGSPQINTMSLFVNNRNVGTLTNPSADGRVTQSVTITQGDENQILNANSAQLEFQIRGTDTGANTIQSNVVRVSRVGNDGLFFYGLSSTLNPATIPLVFLNHHAIEGVGTQLTFTLGPTSANHYIIFLAPTTFPLDQINNLAFGSQNVISEYTQTNNVRIINGQQFISYTFGPTNPDLTLNYQVVFSSP